MSDTTPRLCPYCADVHLAVESCPFRQVMEGPLDTGDLRARVADATQRLEAEEDAQADRHWPWRPFPDPESWAVVYARACGWTPYEEQDLIQQIEPMALADRGVANRWLPLGVTQVYEGDQA